MRLLIASLLVILLTGGIQNKPRILIIGDSISIGYMPFVKQKMADRADVVHNPGNAQHTGTGLEKIEEWVGDGKWDIVQFNWGLWDLCYRHPDSKVQGNRDKVKGDVTYTVEAYAANLDSLATRLKTLTRAKLIFVTTTYVPENEAGRFQNDALRYNEAAKKVMKKHSILVNDLYEPSIPIHREDGKGSDDVHYSNQGYEKLSAFVARFLDAEID